MKTITVPCPGRKNTSDIEPRIKTFESGGAVVTEREVAPPRMTRVHCQKDAEPIRD